MHPWHVQKLPLKFIISECSGQRDAQREALCFQYVSDFEKKQNFSNGTSIT